MDVLGVFYIRSLDECKFLVSFFIFFVMTSSDSRMLICFLFFSSVFGVSCCVWTLCVIEQYVSGKVQVSMRCGACLLLLCLHELSLFI